jgi:hypothetical protein
MIKCEHHVRMLLSPEERHGIAVPWNWNTLTQMENTPGDNMSRIAQKISSMELMVGSVLGFDAAALEGCGDQHTWETAGDAPDSGCYCLVREVEQVHTVRDALTGRRIGIFNSDSKYQVSIYAMDHSCTKAIFMCNEKWTVTVVGWNILSNCELFVITDPNFYRIIMISLNNAGARFLTTYDHDEGNVGMYNANTGEFLMRFGQESVCCQFNFDDTRIFSAEYHSMSIWDADNGSNLLRRDRDLKESLWLLGVGNSSNVWAVTETANIVVCNADGEELGSVGIARDDVDCGAFAQNDNLLVASVTENRRRVTDPPFGLGRPAALTTLYVWSVRSMNCLHRIPLRTSLNCVSYCSHYNSVLLGHSSIQQVSLETGLEVSREVEFGDDVVATVVQSAEVILM